SCYFRIALTQSQSKMAQTSTFGTFHRMLVRQAYNRRNSMLGLLMSVTQNEKAICFRALHNGPGAFVIPNPWDVGSAQILAGLGFKALATSSAASACALGLKDHELTRDEALAHARMIVEATDLPVSADLEKGFGDSPEVVAATIQRAADVGLV